MKETADSPPEQRPAVRLAQACNRLYSRLYHNVRVSGSNQIPRRGPAILVCNHISGLDPLLIQSACSRLIVWMMAREYYDIKAMTWLFKIVEAIPVERSGRDSAATRAALRALSHQRILGIFPEGRIETDRDLLPFQTGVALMAIKTGVPVFPAYLDGTQRGKEMVDAFKWSNQVRLSFGPAIIFDRQSTTKPALEAATEEIRMAVETLKRRTEASA